MSARPLKEELVNKKTLAQLMVENQPLMKGKVGSYDNYLVQPVDFEMLVNGAHGGDYPHSLILIMQERLGLETEEENLLEE